jgi:hypothetical protein
MKVTMAEPAILGRAFMRTKHLLRALTLRSQARLCGVWACPRQTETAVADSLRGRD